MKKILFFAFVMSMTLNVLAQGWERPVPKATEFVTEDTLYIYNVKAGAYFLGNNDWGTRASIKSTQGFKCVFHKFVYEGEEWDGDSYEWTDSIEPNDFGVPNGNGRIEHVCITSDVDQIWVDEETTDADLSNDHCWTIELQESGYYKIGLSYQNATFNQEMYPGAYVGAIGDMADNRLYICDPEIYADYAASFQTDWIFVTVDEYQKNIVAIKTYEAAVSLKTVIDDANTTCAGIDIAAEESVYANLGSTLEELLSAITSVRAKMSEWKGNAASPEHPMDMTSAIVNPYFENNTSDGWNGTKPTGVNYTLMEQYEKEFYNYQDLSNLPDGIYKLNVSGHYRAGFSEGDYAYYAAGDNSVRTASVFAVTATDSLYTHIQATAAGAVVGGLNDGVDEVLVDETQLLYVPSAMYTTSIYTKAGQYQDNSLYVPLEGGNLRIGIAKNGYIGGDWTIIDDWNLTYYGGSDESYKFWLNESLKNVKEYDEETICSKALLEEYTSLLAQADAATTKDEIKSVIVSIQAVCDSIDASILAYAEYKEQLEYCQAYIADPEQGGQLDYDQDDVKALADYLEFDGPEIYETRELTTAEIKAETQKLITMLQNAVKNGMLKGTDVTNMLINPRFQYADGRGWEYTPGINISGGLSDYPCAEAYSMKFDCHQDVEGLKDGLYKVTVNAFYRPRGNGGYDGSESIPAELYLNDFATPVQHIMADHSDEPLWESDFADYQTEEGWVPNGMNGSSVYFREGHYLQEVYGLVEGGKMRLGIRCDENVNDGNWCLWTNFKLYFMAKDEEAIKSVIDTFKERGEELLGSTMGMQESDALSQALDDAAVAKTGDELYTALLALNSAIKEARTSIALYEQMSVMLDELVTALELCQDTATPAAVEKAQNMFDELEGALDNGSWNNETATEKLAELEGIITALRVPAYEDASDENPVDMTSVIINPLYEYNDNEGWNGDAPTAVSFMCCEMFNRNYNYYQELSGLPAGTYSLGLQAFYRAGFAENDYSTYVSSPEANNHAVLYAICGTDTVEVPVVRASAQAQPFEIGGAESQVGEVAFIPNNMEAASYYFESELYKNELIFDVREGEKLIIGVKKETTIPSDWTIFRNWTLNYFGTESQKTGIDTIQPTVLDAQSSVYNLQGMKVNDNYNGIVIINGRKVFRK